MTHHYANELDRVSRERDEWKAQAAKLAEENAMLSRQLAERKPRLDVPIDQQVEALKAENEQLKKERDHYKAQHDQVNTLYTTAMDELAKEREDSAVLARDLIATQADLEQVKQQWCAATREALRWILNVIDLDAMNAKHPGSYERMMTTLYAADAGKDYVALDKVKPLVEALKKAENAIQHVAGINDENRLGWALKDVDAALTHAKSIGL